MYAVVSNNVTSMYKSQLHSMLKMFSISRCLLYQLWGFFKQKFIKLVAIIVHARLKRKSWFFVKNQSV
jgi:hypothetical protein